MRRHKLERDQTNGEWILLNVGGKIFSTTRTTLCTSEPNSMLARMFSRQDESSDSFSSLSDHDEFEDVKDNDIKDKEHKFTDRSVNQSDKTIAETSDRKKRQDCPDSCDTQLQTQRKDSDTCPVQANHNQHQQQQNQSHTHNYNENDCKHDCHQHNNNHHNDKHQHHYKHHESQFGRANSSKTTTKHWRNHTMHQDNSISLRPSPRDSSGAYLIDRSPEYFEPILNYLRHGKLIINHNVNVQGVLEEAKFYGIVSLLPMLELETERWFKKRHHDLIQSQIDYDAQQLLLMRPQQRQLQNSNHRDCTNHSPFDGQPLRRRDVVKVLIRTSGLTRGLRFQGCNLEGTNLSKLDLRFVNFKMANLNGCDLRGANLSYANFERASMKNCNLEGSQLVGANLLHANLESSLLRAVTTRLSSNMDVNQNSILVTNNNIDDIPGVNGNNIGNDNPASQQNASYFKVCTSFESANMRETNFEGSQLQDATFRNAILKGSNLQNCDLTRANLCGADLENCDLSGSDLSEANLRSANVKGAKFELEAS